MKKEPKNTGPPNEAIIEKPNKRNNKKETAAQAAKRFESSLPEVAKRNNIRVSSPYGYYPEDVDSVILEFEKNAKMLEKENNHLTNQLEDCKAKLKDAQTELTKLKMQISLMEIPDTSAEENFAMLSRMSTITGKNEEQIAPKNNIVKTPKKHNITIVQSPNTKSENSSDKKKSPAIISLNLNNKKE